MWPLSDLPALAILYLDLCAVLATAYCFYGMAQGRKMLLNATQPDWRIGLLALCLCPFVRKKVRHV